MDDGQQRGIRAKTTAVPPRPRLNRASVIAAAHEQVGADGLSSLSSRSLAARLGVTPMALYRHVADMDEVVGAVVDRLLSDLGTPDPDARWQDWLEALAHGLRTLFEAHPDALALFNRRPVTSPAARQRLVASLEVLARGGFSAEAATRAYAAVHTYTIGFSALEEGRRLTPAPAGPIDAPDDDDSIAIRAFVSEDQFVHGLRALIRGLDAGSGHP